ncbi:DUF3820 family protein [Oceanobacter mangrovi]|uniref:DUF3820 family protein n=1 Tax=Oceanobacter mangrovi TaxID=2862510 RepID=UPI001C8ED48C|nr:DUF3820 family protein [Oceanobacter mangrovi]
MFDKTDLIRLISTVMPFGKYQGKVLIDLPEEYLLWFSHKGFPDGDLGRLMALALEIRIHGLEDILKPLRAQTAPQTTANQETRH